MRTSVLLRSGDYRYEALEEWEKLPDGVNLVECPGVAVNSKDEVHVLTRNTAFSVLVFDPDGTFKRTFGQGLLSDFCHGISIGSDDSVYCADAGNHTVTKFTSEGALTLTLGKRDEPAELWSGDPFNKPTHVFASPNTGDIFVSDGYGNARIHRFTAEGKHVLSWGEMGIDPGQFIFPHNLVVDAQDRVYVADRECHRVQVFDSEGHFITMWNNIYRPDGLTLGPDGHIYIGELNSVLVPKPPPGLGHRVSIWSVEGEQLARLGDPEEGEQSGGFIAPHGIAVDSNLDIYVGEVSFSAEGGGKSMDPPRELRSLRKLRRAS